MLKEKKKETIVYKKLISSILVVALLNLLGCYSFESVTVPEYKQVEGEDNLIVITKHSNKLYFSDFYFYKDTLRGKASTHSMGKRMDKKIAISDIKSLESEYFDMGKTVLLTLGVGIIVTIILAIMSTFERSTLVLNPPPPSVKGGVGVNQVENLGQFL